MSFLPQQLIEDNDRDSDNESEQSELNFEFDESVLLPDGTPPMLSRRTLNLDDNSSVMDDNDTYIEFEEPTDDSLSYMLHISCDLQSEDDKIPRCLLHRSLNNADCDTLTDNKTRFDFSHADRDRGQNITQVRQILHRNERIHRPPMNPLNISSCTSTSISRSSSYGNILNRDEFTPTTTGLSTPYTHHLSDSESDHTFILSAHQKTRSRSRSMSSFYGEYEQSDFESEYEIDFPDTSPVKRTKHDDHQSTSLEYIQENHECTTQPSSTTTPVPNTFNNSPFQTNSVLFLDVDGVLLNIQEQKTQHPTNIKFNQNVKHMLQNIFLTNCDIVISSSWQFFTDIHLPYLYSFLEDCGWNRTKNIHLLVNLLNINKEIYEQCPYCKSRASNILRVVDQYHIQRYVVFDDLPLASVKYVCIPKMQHMSALIDKLAHAYFQSIVWRHTQRDQIMPGIKEYIKYALTLPNSLFSENSLRFGFEFQSLSIYVCDAIARACPLTFEYESKEVYSKIVSDLQRVLYVYCMGNYDTMGNTDIEGHFVQTDGRNGLSLDNVQRAVGMLVG